MNLRPMKRTVFRLGRFAVYIFKGGVGDHHIVRYKQPMLRKEANYRAILVKGRMRMISAPVDLSQFQDYVAGEGTEDLPDIEVPGVYIRECMEECLLFCVSRGGKSFTYNKPPVGKFEIPTAGIFILGDGIVSYNDSILRGPFSFHAKTQPLRIDIPAPVQGIVAYVTGKEGSLIERAK